MQLNGDFIYIVFRKTIASVNGIVTARFSWVGGEVGCVQIFLSEGYIMNGRKVYNESSRIAISSEEKYKQRNKKNVRNQLKK